MSTITIDGSLGEGGGQVLRSSLALSLVTGQPFTIDRIRAGREQPGLKRQHLTAVQAAAEIGDATVDGDVLGSTRVRFVPRRVRGGDHKFAIGTAGSTTLVLQTLLPALLTADSPSTLVLSGGTHNPLAPPFPFLAQTFVPALRAMGASFDVQLVRAGFAPAGGGMITATIGPSRLHAIDMTQCCAFGLPRAVALITQLPRSIAERELSIVRQRLALHPEQLVIEEVVSNGPGNMLLLEYPTQHGIEVIGVPGERGVPAEEVAERACHLARTFVDAGAPVGAFLADQLLLPMAMAGGGAFRTQEPSQHTRTNADVIERFLPIRFDLRADGGDGSRTWIVEATPR